MRLFWLLAFLATICLVEISTGTGLSGGAANKDVKKKEGSTNSNGVKDKEKDVNVAKNGKDNDNDKQIQKTVTNKDTGKDPKGGSKSVSRKQTPDKQTQKIDAIKEKEKDKKEDPKSGNSKQTPDKQTNTNVAIKDTEKNTKDNPKSGSSKQTADRQTKKTVAIIDKEKDRKEVSKSGNDKKAPNPDNGKILNGVLRILGQKTANSKQKEDKDKSKNKDKVKDKKESSKSGSSKENKDTEKKPTNIFDGVKRVLAEIDKKWNASSVNHFDKTIGILTSGGSSKLKENCHDLPVEGHPTKVTSLKIPGCKRITTITINTDNSGGKCKRNNGCLSDKNNAMIPPGCNGTARVCCIPDEESEEAELRTGSVNCPKPYKELYGHCWYIEKEAEGSFSEATAACARRNGKLAELDNSAVAIFSRLSCLGDQKFWVGTLRNGITDDLAISLSAKFGLSLKQAKSRCQRLALPKKQLKSQPKVSNDLLEDYHPAYDASQGDFTLEDNDNKMLYICEPANATDEENFYRTTFVNSNRDIRKGEVENMRTIIEAWKKNSLGNFKGCEEPIDATYRIVGTTTIITKDNPQGYVLDQCDKSGFKCVNLKQPKNKPCPDVEVSFVCAIDLYDNCSIPCVRKKCERQGKTCHDGPNGPLCVEVPKPRTGNELPSEGYCTVDSVEYKTRECCCYGDPHCGTFNGQKVTVQGACGYMLSAPCNNYKPSDSFPFYSISMMNYRHKITDKVTYPEGYSAVIGNTRYTYSNNTFYVNGTATEICGYKDENIIVKTSSSGHVLQTKFCVSVTWSKEKICVKVPEHYIEELCGFCGDFTPPKNRTQFRIPEKNETTSLSNYEAFYTYFGPSEAPCPERKTLTPAPIPPTKLDTYRDPKLCGCLNLTMKDNPLSRILGLVKAEQRANIIGYMDNHIENCAFDYYMAPETKSRFCEAIKDIIENFLIELKLDTDPNVISAIAATLQQTDCTPKCGQNEEYRTDNKFCEKSWYNILTICTYETKTSSCFCKPGFMRDKNGDCVPEEGAEKTCRVVGSCGKSFYVPDGETIVLKRCEQKATCNNGELVKTDIECSDNAQCSKDGLTCACKHGYEGDGRTCTPVSKCTEGFIAFGTKCYMVECLKMSWSDAAQNCERHGAKLASASSPEFEDLARHIAERLKLCDGKPIPVKCPPGKQVPLPPGHVAVSCRPKQKVAANCTKTHGISDDGKTVIGGTCPGVEDFAVTVVNAKQDSKATCTKDVWIKGCTLFSNTKFSDNFNPDIDQSTLHNSGGCYKAVYNTADGTFVPSPDSNCNDLKNSICERDPAGKEYVIDDVTVLPVKVTQTEAEEACKKDGRELLVTLLPSVLASLIRQQDTLGMRGNVWTKIKLNKNNGDYECPGSSSKSVISYFADMRPTKDNKPCDCAALNLATGKVNSISCTEKLNPACGPRVVGGSVPQYTPAYPCDLATSHAALILKLRNTGSSDSVCNNPLEMECYAEKTNGDGYVVRGTHQIGDDNGALECNKSRIYCKSGKGVNCGTCKVRFLCLQSGNICERMKAQNATLCEGGQTCIPTCTHYECKCSSGYIFNKNTRRCEAQTNACTADSSGIIAFAGTFMGFATDCRIHLVGLCVLPQPATTPQFNVHVIYEKRTDSESRIAGVEIQVKYSGVSRCGSNPHQTLIYVTLGATLSYTINGHPMKSSFAEKDSISIKYTPGLFSLVLKYHGLCLTVVNGAVTVKVGDSFTRYLCGACGESNRQAFRRTDGSFIEIASKNKLLDNAGKLASAVVNNLLPIPTKTCSEILSVYQASVPGLPICSSKPVDVTEGTNCSDPALSRCDIFIDVKGHLIETIIRLGLTGEWYRNLCRKLICSKKNPDDAVCDTAAKLASHCADRHEILDYRNTSFCHKRCKENEVYSPDATEDRECFDKPAVFEHMPREGCRCKEDYRRLNGDCVPKSKCDCNVETFNLMSDYLAVNDYALTEGCSEKVTCVEDETGTISPEVVPVSTPENAYCDINFFKCDTGYKWTADHSKCIKIPNECTEGFKSVGDHCYHASPDKVKWQQAVTLCNKKNSDLINIKDPEDEAKVKQLMLELGVGCVHVGGTVQVECRKETSGGRNNANVDSKSKDIKNNGKKLKPRLNEKEEQDSLWKNHKCSRYVKEKVKVDERFVDDDVKDNETFHLAAILVNGTLEISPTQHKTECFYICDQRGTLNEEDTVKLPRFKSSTCFGNDGRYLSYLSETTSSECAKCDKVLGITCVPVDSRAVAAGQEPYSCSIDKFGARLDCVSGNCAEVYVTITCSRDVDECATGCYSCPKDSHCVNERGSYRCECNKNRPHYIDGECKEAMTCTMSGIQRGDKYTFDLTSFGARTGYFGYDCAFRFLAPCHSSVDYMIAAGIPLIYVYVLKSNINGDNTPIVSIYIRKGENKTFSLRITAKDLGEGKCKAGKTEATLAEAIVGSNFYDAEILTSSLRAGALTIQDRHNNFTMEVSHTDKGFSLKAILSVAYNKTICGVCSKNPTGTPPDYQLSEAHLDEISVQYNARCTRQVTDKTDKVPPSKEGKDKTDKIPPSKEGKDKTDKTPPSKEGKDKTGKVPSSKEGKDKTDKVPSKEGKDKTDKVPSKEGKDKTDKVPPSKEGKDKSDKIPPSKEGKDKTDKVPPSKEGKDKTDKIPPSKEGKDKTDKIPQSKEGKDKTDKVPPSKEGKDKTDKIPPSKEGKDKTDKVPPSKEGKDKTDKVPPSKEGKDKTDKIPPSKEGKDKTDKIPPSKEGKDKTDKVPSKDDKGKPADSSSKEDKPKSTGETCDAGISYFCYNFKDIFNKSEESCLNKLCTGKEDACGFLLDEEIDIDFDVTKANEFLKNLCDSYCDEAATFLLVKKSTQPTCYNPNPVSDGSSIGDYVFRCSCISGFLWSGVKCVPESSCGCVDRNDGSYHLINSEWLSQNCTIRRRCLGKDHIEEVESTCGANAECQITEHGPACVCGYGLHGNPYCPEGCLQGNESSDGSETCYTFYHCENKTSDTRCYCNNGYVSNCSGCEDINECEENMHECNLYTQKCVNKLGGYECKCHDGYKLVKDNCVDIDECAEGKHNCPPHTGCINTDGGYNCECCAGYVPGENSTDCVPESGFNLTADAPCCHKCPDTILCSESSAYCYDGLGQNNRKTFNSFRRMFQEVCLQNRQFDNDRYHKGECSQNTGPPVEGPAPPKNCDDDNICKGKFAPSKALANGAVCGPSNSPQTFPSYCAMVKAVCKQQGGVSKLGSLSAIPATPGACVPGPPTGPILLAEPAFLPWSQYGHCQFEIGDCGKGNKVRTRSAVAIDKRPTREPDASELIETESCFVPCPQTNNNTSPECHSSLICRDPSPVCGTTGTGDAKTYRSECDLNVTACLEGKEPRVLYRQDCNASNDGTRGRFCNKGPVTVLVKKDYVDSGERCTSEEVPVGTCDNLLCESSTNELCCKATKFEQIAVDVTCFNYDTGEYEERKKQVFLSAKTCECQQQIQS